MFRQSQCAFPVKYLASQGDYKEYKEYQEEVVVHDMDDFNRRLISSIRVTEESALSTQTKYGMQEEVEGRNISTISMCVSGEVSGKPGDYKEY